MTDEIKDKRRYRRQPVRYDARLRFEGGRVLHCEIRDFCVGGLYVMFASGEKANVRRDVRVAVLLKDGEGNSYRLTGRIAHATELGVGIAFTEQPPIAALMCLRGRAGASETASKEVETEPVVEWGAVGKICRQALELQLRPVLTDFFREADSVLLDAANEAGTNAEQSVYFEAMAMLKAHRAEVESNFIHDVLEQAETFVVPSSSPRTAEGSGSGLGLVDSKDFEDWLNVNEQIAKIESQHESDLWRIEKRFSWIAHREINRKNNPFGPCVIEHAFRAALTSLTLDNAARRVIYGIFGHVLDPRLTDLYRRLDEITGHLVPTDAGAARPSRAAPESAERPAEPAASPLPPSPASESRPAPAEVPSRRPSAEAPAYMTTPYAAAGNLLRLCTQQQGASQAEGGGSEAMRDTGAVIKALRRLQARKAAQQVEYLQTPTLEAELAQDLSSPESRLVLGEEHRQTIEILGALLDKVVNQDWVPQGVKPYVQELQIPLLEAALADGGLIHGESHPARDVVNLMDRLALATNAKGEIENAPLRRSIEAISQRIVREAADNPAVFEEAKEQLEQLTAPLLKARAKHIARLQETYEAKNRMESAHRIVAEVVDQRIAGKSVPAVVPRLLDAGWRQLLVLTVLRDGVDSPQWKARLDVLDRLLQWLGPENAGGAVPTLPAHRVIGQVDDELATVCPEPLTRNRISLELTALLLGKSGTGERKEAEFVSLPARTPEPQDEAVPRIDLPPVRLGDWLDFSPAAGVRTPLRLSWVGEDPPRYVFTNYQGYKELELSAAQLARYLAEKHASVGEDRELPLLERAAGQLVQSMQEKLRFQASHDAVTGLINRREFMRQLPSRLGRSEERGPAFHLLCMLDLAQLRVINHLCGIEAGDRLLKEICVILRATFKGDHLLARLGDSSFGLLFRAESQDETRERGEALLQAIADHHFRWGEHSFTLAASLGVATVPGIGGDPEALLRNADTACMAAKEKGPNRMQVYAAGDVSLEAQQQLMDWAGRIDRLLAEDRLTARCQMIAPIFPEREAHSHYEILLGIRTESGEQISPLDFVMAAERWNRASEIDRWQVQAAFRWIRENRAAFEGMGGFSINLSGQSLNSEDFLAFLHAELARQDVPADKITFEITETAALGEFSHAGKFIRQIRRHGCRFSLDDFGSGFSSYAYLKNLQVDYLKIDGSFVRDLAASQTDYALVKSMNDIAHSLGIKTIAEYVETDAIMAKLREIGVDYAQGYAVRKPFPLAELAAASPVREKSPVSVHVVNVVASG